MAELASLLADLVHLSLHCGEFPTALKEALIIPMHKKGSKEGSTNYCPVSFKNYKKKVFKRIVQFINKHKILNHTQNIFTHGRSTSRAIFQVLEEIAEGINQCGSTVCVVLLKKVLRKENYWFRGITLQSLWLAESSVYMRTMEIDAE